MKARPRPWVSPLAKIPRRPRLPGGPSEQTVQASIAAALEVGLKGICAWTAIDAGAGKMTKAAAGLRKARGVKAGWPDIILVHQGRFYGLEVKDADGSLSADQRDLHAWLRACKAEVAVVRSIEEAVRAIRAWGIPIRVTLGVRPAEEVSRAF
jgi:hypothetical protein